MLDIEENPAAVAKYETSGIPVLMVFTGGELVKQHRGGFRDKFSLRDFLDEFLR